MTVSKQDVGVNGTHLWVKLKDQGGLRFLVVDYHVVAAGTCSEEKLVHFKDGLRTIPNVSVTAVTYKVTLQMIGAELLFGIKDALTLSLYSTEGVKKSV